MAGFTRRHLLASLASMGGVALLGGTEIARAAASSRATAKSAGDLATHARDWDWLAGDFDVAHRRLKERLVGDTRWEEFGGKSVFWHTLDGLGNIADTFIALPAGDYRGLAIRAYDPATAQWLIWWVDSRDPTRIDPPVHGRFDGDSGLFYGDDTWRGQPILVRFLWRDVHGLHPLWEQAFSLDHGKTWEVNWRNTFTRAATTTGSLPRLSDAPNDWRFLDGEWRAQHRRKPMRAGATAWETFDGTLKHWPVLGGHAHVGDHVLNMPGGTVRGVSLCNHDAQSRQWRSWWLDGSDPTRFVEPLRGAFDNGIAVLLGETTFDGKPVPLRATWWRLDADHARCEHAHSLNQGGTWETNWVGEFTRVA